MMKKKKKKNMRKIVRKKIIQLEVCNGVIFGLASNGSLYELGHWDDYYQSRWKLAAKSPAADER